MKKPSGQPHTIPSGNEGELQTAALQAAIDAAEETGGVVRIPPGVHRTGTLRLRSRMVLHLEPGAVLQGSGDLADYPEIGSVIHHESGRSLLVADNCEDLVITGGGTIDGNGMAFWQQPEGSEWYIGKDGERPHPMIELRDCRNVRIDGVRIINSPGWTVHPFRCDNLTLRDVVVENHLFGPNTDGFDIDGCRDVVITGCRLHCGDDGIIIKATPKARSTERVTISDCIIKTNCIGIGIGQETECDVRQVAVSNCVLYKCHRMIGIGIWNGGTVEDVTISNITGDTLAHYSFQRPIQMEVKQSAHLPQTNPLGAIRNVTLSGFNARTQGRILITAQEGATIENISLRDIRLDIVHLEDNTLLKMDPDWGSNQLANRNLEARRQPAAIVLENLRNLDLHGLRVTWPPAGAPSQAKGGPQRPHDSPDPAFSVLWARNVSGAHVHAPSTGPSDPSAPAAVIANCEGDIEVG
ncbi:MAG: glycoside hydrolase family 28 protein [Oceanipulchritudo sp.]